MNRTGRERLWEIDVIRGTALVLMIFFHILFTLKEVYGYDVHYNQGIYYYIGKTSAIMFILISAVSTSFSRNNIKRALKFIAVAALITVVTHLYNPALGIKFGIIHFLGLSVLLAQVFNKISSYLLAVLGILIIAAGLFLGPIAFDNNYLFLFNMTGTGWVSADYYPLFPWFGVFLFGIILGRVFYPAKVSRFDSEPRSGLINFLGFLGRHTLIIYLIHEPVLVLLIGVYKKILG
ncbi:MAG TPA: heparan-alpha-glucosaminide N-acetyltransferase [Desulfobacteria bacterium]|nr:heparan-alpha-glucosaminide N-acetyltransferase [Desulfobacteria bacterium]